MQLVLMQLSLGLYSFIHLSCKYSPQNYFLLYSLCYVLPWGQVASFHTRKTINVIEEKCALWVTFRTRPLSWNIGYGNDSFLVINFLLTRKILLACRLYYADSFDDWRKVNSFGQKKELCSHIRLLYGTWQKGIEGANKILVKVDTSSTMFRTGHLPRTGQPSYCIIRLRNRRLPFSEVWCF
jgi:hypothetical protein